MDGQRHLTILHSCAANCLLYEEDPGPAELNIGSELEPHMVPRSHAWRDFYAHHLITQLSADSDRLAQCSEWAHQQHDRDDLPADMTGPEREEAKQFWQCAIDIAARAIEIVGGGGGAPGGGGRPPGGAGRPPRPAQTPGGARAARGAPG
ncbi:hypothetical protein ACFXO7_38640, partial [Nocardia tengchongensis]|uniref:hypothetical protein n=1 Tax=Nocardia tengchongensis TaxID=2055889 RepID=UPI0036ADA4FF